MHPSDIIFKYFPQLSTRQKKQFYQLQELYTHWNQKINVISRKDIDQLYSRHVLHSLGIAKVYQFQKGQKVLDVGTGGGFPGIPLAILFPETHFYLIDSIQKKVKVVQEVVDNLDLKNVSTEHIRAEKVKSQFDFVISRAVTRLKPFTNWVKGKINNVSRADSTGIINNNGILYLKGGDLKEELQEINRPYQIFPLKDYFSEDFFDTKVVVYLPY
ncbi:16S rRNA (guanine(527)-N(7))-methyltransferase RsmG [Fulvivirgaceae bacterium BMA10]|uniref:Ribosomal RNA small subunit methyltransferase G n=1 Tax=Splendidivirga corallicola TaxID=3051826 RepID=A0ABT8KJQ6_9BACT|nr:16S rRNA (guanine(527)-N(7))-methyltransferase RsmG [Fulvivirgaceae bacterium BMA10]